MKFAILGDLHFGCRGDSSTFHKYFEKFYSTVFFPYCKENNIKIVFQLGDLFDRRKYINFNSLAECKSYFFNELKANDMQLITLLGNHDIFFKESLEVNSTGLILGEYENIMLIDKPSTYTIDNTTIDLIPWICKENENDVFEFINTSKSDLCFGHFEIAGFPMYRGTTNNDGLSRDVFAKYERVLSGHYHTRSKIDNIEYVGTPYEMTWQDAYDPRGFSVFDTQSRELEFIINPHAIHTKITYDDSNNIPDVRALDLKDVFIKINVINKTKINLFEQFISAIYNKNPADVKIIEDLSEFKEGDISDEIDIEDTLTVLSTYIDSIETVRNKEPIKNLLKELYIEAINKEVV